MSLLKKFLATLGLLWLLAGVSAKPVHAQYAWFPGGSGTASCTVPIANDGATGTTLHTFVKITTAGAVVNASTSDTTKIVGVVTANAGTTGSASVQVCGIALVNFDGGVTAADSVIASTTAGGKGHDSGSQTPSTTVEDLGVIVSPTNAAAGQYVVLLANIYRGGVANGSVTSVGLTMPTGFSVAGSPVTSSGTLAVTFSTESANAFLGGPVSGVAATPTFRALGAYDVPGNNIPVANSATGTTLNKLVKFTAAAPSTAIITSAGDTTGIKGVCIQGCGTTGTAIIQQSGQVQVAFDGATTANHYVQQSASVNGDATDAGGTYPTSGGEVLGIIESTNGGAGTYTMDLFSPDTVVATNVAVTGNSTSVPNNGSTGTSVNHLASYDNGSSPGAIIATTTSDGPFIGIVTGGAGTTGWATITTSGAAVSCAFDGATTKGDVVIASTSVAGDCHDSGSATPSTILEPLGTVNSTNGSAGTYTVNFQTPWPASLGGFQICDKSTLNANQYHLLLVSNGSGINTFCNNQSTPNIQGNYNLAGAISLSGNNALTLNGGITGNRTLVFNGGGVIQNTFRNNPALSSCGSGTSVEAHSSSMAGEFTVGTTSGGVCTMTLRTDSCVSILECNFTDGTAAHALWEASNSANSIVVHGVSDSDVVHYTCFCE